MTQEEFEILLSDKARRAVDENIMRNPTDIALDKRIGHAALIATQVKRLQRAKVKLPMLYKVRAIMPPKAYEQSSSELCAERKRLFGGSVLDLTCGLGVDSIALSRRFGRVVSCERDSVLSQITRYNLSLLGIDNVEVVNCSAEEYLASTTEHFDWIFADPDRRDANDKKLVRLCDCSPDIVTLYPRIKEVADALCIKCSPLFDTAEAARIFGECSVETVSLNSECKEVNIYVDGKTPSLAAEAVGLFRFEISRAEIENITPQTPDFQPQNYRYAILPDVALVHSRLTFAAFAGIVDIWTNTGVALAANLPEKIFGRVFKIEAIHEINSKELKRELKGRKIKIYRRDFPLSNSEICRKFSAKEGEDLTWCFTRIGAKNLAIRLAMCKMADGTE